MCTQYGRRKRAAGARFTAFQGATAEVAEKVDELLASGAKVLQMNTAVHSSTPGLYGDVVVSVIYVDGYFAERRENQDDEEAGDSADPYADPADPYASLNTTPVAE